MTQENQLMDDYALKGNFDKVKQMLDEQNKPGFFTLTNAAENKYWDIVELVLPYETGRENKASVLMDAALDNKLDLVKLFIKFETNPDDVCFVINRKRIKTKDYLKDKVTQEIYNIIFG